MKFAKKKTTASLTALVLIATMTLSIVILPNVTAHDPPWNHPTFAFLSVAPETIGVGQTTVVAFWLSYYPPTASGAYGDRWTFNVEVTKPNGNKETLGPFTSDPVGSSWCNYTPDSVGTYYFQAFHKGTTITNPNPDPSLTAEQKSYIGDYYKPSNSTLVPLIVQQEPIETYPGGPLPTDYWERPIEGQNREWWSISGNWMMFGNLDGTPNTPSTSQRGGGVNLYSTAPGSAHIVWTKPLMFGGIMGGELSEAGGTGSYYNGMSYEVELAPPIIMQGRLYYNTPPSQKPNYGSYCVDLRTGEEIWFQNDTSVTMGQIYNYISPNQFGGTAYLWRTGTTYKLYDAFTGRWILDMVNASTGIIQYSPVGDVLVYVLNAGGSWLAMWNSSKVSGMLGGTSGSPAWQWRPPQGAKLDWRTGIQWNVSIPKVPEQAIIKINSEVIWSRSMPARAGWYSATPGIVDIGYDAKTGKTLWIQNRTADEENIPSRAQATMTDGVFTEYVKEKMVWYGYDIYTGQKLWGPSEPYNSNAWGSYYRSAYAAYGKLYAGQLDGKVYSHDVKTGKKVWEFNTGSSDFETAYGNWPLVGMTIADHKIFVTGGHTHLQPLYRGARLYCLDSETGEEKWNVLGWFHATSPVIADGYMITANGYDNQIYCFGKGQTAMTVSTPLTALPLGSSLMIQGSVTDQSPGAEGTPAISDASMTQWMEYLYMQKPKPTNATGVTVVLQTLDPNGNLVPIGNVTSDASGLFKKMWTPEIPGEHTVIATFPGSESYWGCFAESAVGITETISSTPTPSPLASVADLYFVPAVIGLFLAIILVGVIMVFILRKRP